MDLISLYQAIVLASGWSINENGTILGASGPRQIGGKTLILPTKEFLKNPDWDNFVAFHPLSENVLRGESEVLQDLRMQMMFSLNFVSSMIIQGLTDLAADPARQKKLKIKQKKYLELVPNFDQKTEKAVGTVLDKADVKVPEKVINLYVKRGGEKGDEKFKYLASVSSPLREELIDTDDRTVWGVKFRVKEYNQFRELIDFIMPDVMDEQYSYGTSSLVAPRFHALVNGFVAIATRLNEVLDMFEGVFGEDYELLRYDLDFADEIEDITKFKGKIPALPHNKGSTAPDDEEDDEDAETTAPKKSAKSRWKEKAAKNEGEQRKLTLAEKLEEKTQPEEKPRGGWGNSNRSTRREEATSERKSLSDVLGVSNSRRDRGGRRGSWGGRDDRGRGRESTPYNTGGGWGSNRRRGGW